MTRSCHLQRWRDIGQSRVLSRVESEFSSVPVKLKMLIRHPRGDNEEAKG